MSLLRSARRSGIERGLLGGSRTWLVIGGAAWALRGLKWASQPTSETVYRGRLEVGETLVIRHDPPEPTRHQRRQTRRAEKKATERARIADRKESRGSRRRDRRTKH